LSSICKIYKEIKKPEKEKEEKKKKNKKRLRVPLGPDQKKEPAAHLVFPETVSRFLPYLADRWTPTARFFFLQRFPRARSLRAVTPRPPLNHD
jgi:hypothetical protein